MNSADTELDRLLLGEGVSLLRAPQGSEAELDQDQILDQLAV